ncbi:MAG: thioredoxin family protein [Muribaculaceae bacterium]|nr:thioredoxin family protein [Muribaculaceae bacterium]
MKTFEEVIRGKVPSLVVFIHAGQQDAVEIKYNMQELQKKYGDKVNIMRVDGSYDHRLAHQYDLRTYPTYILLKEGQELMRESGDKSVAELSELIERAF